jgi:hypothetical protein
MNDNAIPTPMCDIVLKGGLTSGVVYPLALVRLAKNFRFSNIGGTSAGAIAAAAAAAAEYGRQTGGGRGFARLEQIPEEIGPHLLALFQPSPVLKPVYDTFITLLNAAPAVGAATALVGQYWRKKADDTSVAAPNARPDVAKVLTALWTPLKGYWRWALAGLAPGILIIPLAKSSGWVAFGLLVALLGLIGAMVGRFAYAAAVELVKNDYGLCPGIRQPYSGAEAFTDWLTRLIDEAAGRGKGQDPLTFGDLANLASGKINLAMMTTSLMEERPYTLPTLGSQQPTVAP